MAFGSVVPQLGSAARVTASLKWLCYRVARTDCIRQDLDVVVSADFPTAEGVLVSDQSQTGYWIFSRCVSPGSSALQSSDPSAKSSIVAFNVTHKIFVTLWSNNG